MTGARGILTAVSLLGALATAVPLGADGHTRSQSSSTWTIEGRSLEGRFTIDARRATLLYGLDGSGSLGARLAEHLQQTVRVRQDGEACRARPPRALAAATGFLRGGLAFTCPEPLDETPAELEMGAFFPLSAGHTHLLRAGKAAGETPESVERVLTEASHTVRLGGEHGVSPGGFTEFLALGAEHVLVGLDHLAFLAALLLLCSGVGQVVVTVTGFTLGHSVTLALAVLGLIEPVAPAVETLIGFSVAFAAVQAVLPRARLPRGWLLLLPVVVLAPPALAAPLGGSPVPLTVFAGLAVFALAAALYAADPMRPSGRALAPALAVAFGLAHGAGFAGVLMAMELPPGSLAPALLGFNLGVEAGQLAVVAVLALVGAGAARRLPGRGAVLHDAAAAALAGIGTYWFVARALGA